MSEKKYELVMEDTIKHNTHYDLFRIRALKDIPIHGVKVGDLGGYIESPFNLSQDGSCWVADNAKVSELSQVKDSALIKDDASIENGSIIKGRAIISDKTHIVNSVVGGDSRIGGTSTIINSSVKDKVEVFGESKDNRPLVIETQLSNKAKVLDRAMVTDSTISDNVIIKDEATVSQLTHVSQNARVYGKAIVESSNISGNVSICDSATVVGCSLKYGENIGGVVFVNSNDDITFTVNGRSEVTAVTDSQTDVTEIFDTIVEK